MQLRLLISTIIAFSFGVTASSENINFPRPDASFQEKIDKPLPPWMEQQIKKTVSRFTHHLSKRHLDKLAQNKKFGILVRIKIIDGVYFFEVDPNIKEHSVVKDWNKIFQELFNSGRLPAHLNIDFVLSCNDGYGGPCDRMVLSNDVYIHQSTEKARHRYEPIFVQADCEHHSYIILPSWTFFELKNKEMILQGSSIPWEQREQVLFFRGSDSDAIPPHWAKSPRVKLILLSLQFPHLINAAFALDTIHHQPDDSLPISQMIRDFVTLDQHCRYRYLIDLDGNCASNPRNQLYLLSSSLIFKTMTPSISWFYPALIPYQHFIPLKPDLSDLMSQLTYALTHDDECRLIAQNARQLGEELWNSMDIYIYHLLEAYANQQALYYNQ